MALRPHVPLPAASAVFVAAALLASASPRTPGPPPATKPAARPTPPAAGPRPTTATRPAPATRPAAPATQPAVSEGALREALAAEVRKWVEQFRASRLKHRDDAEAELLALHRELLSLHKAYLAALAEYGDDTDPEVRARVAEVLAETIAAARFERVLLKLPPDQGKKLLALRKTHPALVTDVFSLSWSRRLAAIQKIGKMRDRQGAAEPLIVLCLRHPWQPLASAAITAAGENEYNSPAIVDGLLRILRETSSSDWQRGWYDRTNQYPHIAAMNALKRIKPKRAAPALLAMMPSRNGGDPRQSLALADLIAATGEIRAIPALMAGLKDTSTYSTWRSGNTKVTMARSDGALMALVKLTAQAPESYKFVTYPRSTSYQPIYGFSDDKARKAAIERFKKWWQKYKDQPPYKGMDPLPLPASGSEDS